MFGWSAIRSSHAVYPPVGRPSCVSLKYRLSYVYRTGSREMIDAGSSRGSVCHCLAVYPWMNASYSGRPISDTPPARPGSPDAAPSSSAACSRTNARAASGPYADRKNWLIVPRLIGIGNTSPPRCVVYTRCTYDVNVVNRLTYSHTRSFDVWNRCAPRTGAPRSPRVRVRLAVRVAAQMTTTVDHEHLAPLLGHPLRDGQAEQPGTDDDEVGHALLLLGWSVGVVSRW